MTIYIYGEAHFQQASVKFIRDEIIRLKPRVLIHELVGDHAIAANDVDQHLRDCVIGGICDPETNRDIFEIASELKIPLIGCDLSVDELGSIKRLSLEKQLALREKRMLEIIRISSYAAGPKASNVVAVVGDIHLREKKNPELGYPSVIYSAVRAGTLKAEIIRCDKQWREAE